MPRFRILTYDLSSESAHRLAKELGGHDLIRPHGSSYQPRTGDAVINWGLYGCRGYSIAANQHAAVEICVSKLRTLEAFRRAHVKHPAFSRSGMDARLWLSQGYNVYARTKDSGMMGEGIKVIHPTDNCIDIPPAPLYTRGFSIHREFRVYAAFGNVIDVREKKARVGTPANDEIRANDDWMYCRNGLAEYPATVLLQSLAALYAVGLDFGGVDVAIDKDDNVTVFEVNSAPWLPSSTAAMLGRALQIKLGAAA